jgi:hypothetical protein
MKTYIFDPSLPEMTEAVKTIVLDTSAATIGNGEISTFEVLEAVRNFNQEGPYCMGKRLNLLVNNSAEDMAIEFMTFVNQIFPYTF